MITTTLRRINQANCWPGPVPRQERLLKGLGKTVTDDEPLPFAQIVEFNGLDDAVDCFDAEPQYAVEAQAFAVWCCRRVEHLMTDPLSIAALDVAERHAKGDVPREELWQAIEGTGKATNSADPKRLAAWYAARAAQAVMWAVASPSGFTAVQVRLAVGEAWAAAMSATTSASAAQAVSVYERAAQTTKFLRIVTETEARE